MRAAKPRAHHVQVVKNMFPPSPQRSPGISPPKTHAPRQNKPLWWEAHVPQLESDPLLPQVEKAHVQQEDAEQTETNK